MPILVSIFTWLVDRFGVTAVKSVTLASAKAVSWIAIIAVYAFVVGGVLKVVELVQNVLNQIMSLGGSNVGNMINNTLHCSGVWSAFESIFPILFTSIIFVLVVVLNSILLTIKNKLETDIKDFLSVI